MAETLSKTRAEHWRQRKQFALPVRRLTLLFFGLLILIVAALPMFAFPRLGFWLLPLGMVYLALLYLFPRFWLWCLPMATVVLDYSASSGRLLYTEFDFLLFITVASGFLYRRLRFDVLFNSTSPGLLGIFLVLVLLNLQSWSSLLLLPQAVTGNPYLSDAYSFRAFKGVLVALLLVPMLGHLMARDKQHTVRALAGGLSLAAVALVVLVLWERGTLGVLFAGSPWWAVMQSLLDLSSSYRVTATFADMHTGGETIDGVILLLLPGALYLLFSRERPGLRLLGAAAAASLVYVTLVGFTRTTYVALALAAAFYALLTLLYFRRAGLGRALPLSLSLQALAVLTVASITAFQMAGSYGLLAVAMLFAGLVASRWLPAGNARSYAWVVALLCTLPIALWAHWSSRWAAPGLVTSALLAAVLLIAAVVLRPLSLALQPMARVDQGLLLASLLCIPAAVAFASGGFQMTTRLADVGEDMGTRLDHWSDVINSADGGLSGALLGNGLGSFPAAYARQFPERVDALGTFRLQQDGPRTLLQLGGGSDLRLAQRVMIVPDLEYTVRLRVRSNSGARLRLSLCERNVIFATNFHPRCASKALQVPGTEGEFVDLSIEIDSGRVGRRGLLSRWPTVFQVRNVSAGTLIEIDTLSLSDDGFNRLLNPRFNEGLDAWFHYNDFAHLPWHVKNTYVLVWFELGLVGLLVFFAMLLRLLQSTLQARSMDSLMPVFCAGVVGICLLGFFGTPIDSPRVAWLFYFYLLCGLSDFRIRQPSRRREEEPEALRTVPPRSRSGKRRKRSRGSQ